MHKETLKLLIVDDEHLVRNLLRSCLDWNEIGYEICGEAASAQEALDLLEETNPDVIFTDIYMPAMNGIEFARTVLEEHPAISVVILTGYDEFEFAQQSIEIGVSDFILKPINDEEIRRVAVSLHDKILMSKRHIQEFDLLKKQLKDNLPYLAEKQLNEIITTDLIDLTQIERNLDFLNIHLNTEYVQIALVDVSLRDSTVTHPEDLILLRMKCAESVKRAFEDTQQVNIFLDNSQRIVIICGHTDLNLTHRMEQLRIRLIQQLYCVVCIGISQTYHTIQKTKIAFREACDALDHSLIYGKNKVISYIDINFPTVEQYFIQQSELDLLAFSLKAGLKPKVQDIVENAFNELSQVKQVKIETIRVNASAMISVILKIIDDMQINYVSIFAQEAQPFEKIFDFDTLPEIKAYMIRLVQTTADYVGNMQTRKVDQTISQVKDYILANLSRSDLTLSETAGHFYLNMSYLSRVFKQATGQTFIEFITKTRMEQAIELLRNTDLKAYEISEKIGIENPHYFSVCFKRYTGMTINQFRNLNN